MRAIVALVFVACSGQIAYAPTPLPQTAAGDAAAFGPGLLAASPSEVRFELARPAYVTVLRVFDEWIELVYPFDPARQSFTPAPLASHQLRFKPGTRRVGLPVPQDGAYVTELTDARVAAGIASQHECAVMPRPTDPPRGTGTDVPEVRSPYVARVD